MMTKTQQNQLFMEQIDTLIEARWVVPVEPFGTVLEHHALAVRAGKIVALLPIAQARARFDAAQTVPLEQHVLAPGLVNAHTHAAMSLLRGYADDTPLMTWLQDHIWPAEGRLVSPEFVKAGTLHAAAEMLRGGVTTMNDMYFFPGASAQAALELGIRAVLGIIAIEFPSAYASDADDYLTKGLEAKDALRGEPLISFTLAPHAPYTVSDATFARIRALADELQLPVHVHLHETAFEVEESLKQHGLRPLARLEKLGLVPRR
jgi:5-methylthioadenosine/S-adenosylhomocysteine deaminase